MAERDEVHTIKTCPLQDLPEGEAQQPAHIPRISDNKETACEKPDIHSV